MSKGIYLRYIHYVTEDGIDSDYQPSYIPRIGECVDFGEYTGKYRVIDVVYVRDLNELVEIQILIKKENESN